jgi:hypothetical protein
MGFVFVVADELYKMTYWNGPTAPVAVNVKSARVNLYVPPDCAEAEMVITSGVAPERFVRETVVMSANTASSEAEGALAALDRAIFRVSPVVGVKLCSPFARSSTKMFTLENATDMIFRF